MKYLILIIALFLSITSFAQGRYSVTGMVVDENSRPLKSATVFISGSQKITMTNDSGSLNYPECSRDILLFPSRC